MEIYKDKLGWTDALLLARTEKKIWRVVGLSLLVAVITLAIMNVWLIHFSLNKLNGQRLLLVAPGMNIGPVEIPAETQIAPAVLKYFAKKVVTLNEQWSYETLQDNMHELFSFYYDEQLEKFARANLSSTDRINFVTQKKMVSVFRIDWNKSKVSWCAKIKRGCALISGERQLFMENNHPYSWKPVSYLIFFQALYPTDENPHAMRVTRLLTEDNAENPHEVLQEQFELAEKGKINDY